MNYELQTTDNWQLETDNCRVSSTFVEESLQIRLFMQNKAKFRKSQMNVRYVITADYEKSTLGERGKNKANTKPIKANQSQSKPICRMLKMNITSFVTKDYENMSNWAICENKANTNPNKANFRGKKMLLSTFMLWDI